MLGRAVRRFAKDERGNALLLFGLALVPLIGSAGGAVDYAEALRRRTELQIALDGATMAVARQAPMAATETQTAIHNATAERLTASGIKPEEWRIVTAADVNGRVSATAELKVQTRFLGLMGIPEMTMSTSTEVARHKKLEVALVLDTTGSMATNNRIGALRDAARTLIDSLYAAPNAKDMVKTALVPFVTTVNIKVPGVFDWAWIDTGAKAKYHGINFNLTNGQRTSHIKLFNDLFNRTDGSGWKGCVEARAEPYDVEDTPPDPSVPDTLFVPWFWPDEPDSGIAYVAGTAYNNNYMPDDYTVPQGTDPKTTAPDRQRNTTKYRNKRSYATIDQTPSDTSGPNKSCPEPLTPLTNDADLMRTRIAAMRPWNNSGTNIAQGMVWGWSVLSPEIPFTEGVPYDDPTTQKAMIVLTDGENEVYGGWSNHNRSDYSSYNYLGVNRLGTTDKTQGVAKVNEKVAALCAKIKAKNIRVYTITFELNSATGQALFRDCATKPELYYNSPSTGELKNIFQLIANDLGRLRFSR